MKKFIKRIKKTLFRSENKIIFLLLGFLGLSSGCEDIFSSKTEYGIPSADFIINGKVKSTTTSQAIKDIQIINDLDTIYTNEKGEFRIEKKYLYPENQNFRVEVKDIDAEENGSFKDKEIQVVFENNNFEGGDGDWYHGKVEKDVEISLENKDDN